MPWAGWSNASTSWLLSTIGTRYDGCRKGAVYYINPRALLVLTFNNIERMVGKFDLSRIRTQNVAFEFSIPCPIRLYCFFCLLIWFLFFSTFVDNIAATTHSNSISGHILLILTRILTLICGQYVYFLASQDVCGLWGLLFKYCAVFKLSSHWSCLTHNCA